MCDGGDTMEFYSVLSADRLLCYFSIPTFDAVFEQFQDNFRVSSMHDFRKDCLKKSNSTNCLWPKCRQRTCKHLRIKLSVKHFSMMRDQGRMNLVSVC